MSFPLLGGPLETASLYGSTPAGLRPSKKAWQGSRPGAASSALRWICASSNRPPADAPRAAGGRGPVYHALGQARAIGDCGVVSDGAGGGDGLVRLVGPRLPGRPVD